MSFLETEVDAISHSISGGLAGALFGSVVMLVTTTAATPVAANWTLIGQFAAAGAAVCGISRLIGPKTGAIVTGAALGGGIGILLSPLHPLVMLLGVVYGVMHGLDTQKRAEDVLLHTRRHKKALQYEELHKEPQHPSAVERNLARSNLKPVL